MKNRDIQELPSVSKAKSSPPNAPKEQIATKEEEETTIKKDLEVMSVSELVKFKGESIENFESFLDFTADEISEEEMKRRAKEKERKQKERERKQRLNEIQGQYKPRYRHNRDGTKNPDPAVVMKGKSLFRTIAFTVIATFRLKKIDAEMDFKNRMAEENNVEKDCSAFLEIAQTMMSRAIRALMLSVIESKTLQIDIKADSNIVTNPFSAFFKSKAGTGSGNLAERMLKLKVRIHGILKCLNERNSDWISGANTGQMVAIVNYFKLFFKDRVYWPKGILFKSEQSFLDIRKSGTMRMPNIDTKTENKNNITPESIALFRKYAQRIVLSLMVHRVLIPGVILAPTQCGLGRPVNKHAEKNLVYIASILYMLRRVFILNRKMLELLPPVFQRGH